MEKGQGLLNELLSFLEDELSIVTGSYQAPAAGHAAPLGIPECCKSPGFSLFVFPYKYLEWKIDGRARRRQH